MKKYLLAFLIVLVVVLVGCVGKKQETEPSIIPDSSVTLKNPDNQSHTQTPASEDSGQDISAQVTTKEYAQPKMEGEITISTMFELEYMTAAANLFTSKYPGVKVVINAYSDGTGKISSEDYRVYLNTKIMTGKAEDLIFTGNLPVKKYTDMGVFEDLSYFLSVSPEFNSENYFMNVLEAPRDRAGKLYVLPLMCFFRW